MQRRDFIALLGSAATAGPLPVLAGQGEVGKIGVLLLGYPDPSTFIMGLREGLRELGYEEGRSINLIVRSADGNATALASLAADLIRSQVNIIVAYPTTAGLAAKKVTDELPVAAQRATSRRSVRYSLRRARRWPHRHLSRFRPAERGWQLTP